MDLYAAGPELPDLELRENQVIRIYDIVFDYENLLGTDKFFRTLCRGDAFQQTMGTAEFHNLVGKYLAEREDQTGVRGRTCSPPRTATGCRSSPARRATAASA
jgi:deoxyhypusine synthase